ncbi:hypothetical protein ABGF48_07285 [Helcococcus bovis]
MKIKEYYKKSFILFRRRADISMNIETFVKFMIILVTKYFNTCMIFLDY